MLARSLSSSALRVLLFSIFAGLAVGVVGCGGGGAAPEPKVSEPEMTPEEIAAETKRRQLESIKSNFERVKKVIRKNPNDFFNNMDNLRGILYGAEGTIYERQVQEELDAQNQGLVDFADKQLDSLLEDVNKHMEKRDWDEAERALSLFERNAEAFNKLPAWDRYEAELERVRTAGLAEQAAREILGRASRYKRQGEIARALGMLIAFPDRYKETKEYAEIQETIGVYLDEYKVLLAAKQKNDAVPFLDLEIDEFLSNFDHVMRAGEDDVWSGVDGVAEGDNEGEVPAPLVLGTDEWEHWTVEFTVKYTGDDPFRLGITTGITRFSGGKQQWATYPLPDLETDSWHTLRVTVSDGEIDIHDVTTGTKMKEGMPKANATGGLAWFLMPGQKLFVKDVKYKIVSKIEHEKSDEEAKDDSDGDSDGDSGGEDEGDGKK